VVFGVAGAALLWPCCRWRTRTRICAQALLWFATPQYVKSATSTMALATEPPQVPQ